ncbi:MAG: hypothetical protein KDD82_01845 [Planctomycetes bacterium]|nr:hypothetical protein [Planctomycetota bacterium]
MSTFDTLIHGSAPGLPATHALLSSPEAVREALGYAPRSVSSVSAKRPAVLVSLGPDVLSLVRVRRVVHRGGEAIVEYVVRRNHEFPTCFQRPRSPLHLVQLERPTERLRFVRFTEGTVYGQLIQGEDGRTRLLELPELGLLEDEAYLLHRSGWTFRGAFRARVADAWVHEGNYRVPLCFTPGGGAQESVLQLVGADAQRALSAHAGAAVAVHGLVQNTTRRILPWTVVPAFFEQETLLFEASEASKELAAA